MEQHRDGLGTKKDLAMYRIQISKSDLISCH